MKKVLSLVVSILLVSSICAYAEVKDKKDEKVKEEKDTGRVIYEENFDDLEEGEESGFTYLDDAYRKTTTISVQSKITRGKKALRVDPGEGEYLHNLFGVQRVAEFENDNAKITFYYYQQGLSSLMVTIWNATIRENCDFEIPLEEGKWTKVVMRVSKFIVKTSKKGSINKGDKIAELKFYGFVTPGKPRAEQFFIIDDVKITGGK